jgi:hypothetical protein
MGPTYKDDGAGSSARALRRIVLVALCIALTIAALNVAPWLWRGQLPRPLPPDLSNCTRIEIRYFPTILGYPVWRSEAEKDLLTPEEVQHVEALLQLVVDDPERISEFAEMVASGSYAGVQSGAPSTKTVASVLCYTSDRPPIRLRLYGTSRLTTEDNRIFSYRAPLGILTRISSQVTSSQRLQQIRSRIQCARNLDYLYSGLRGFERHVVYPSPSTWCDTILNRYLDQALTERLVRKCFECPAAREGSCNYGMNPSCKPDSLPETVLLFEIRHGWNRYNGPGLFAFDNHNPKGGCVLLNDGTVKFIRTEEELGLLRWK